MSILTVSGLCKSYPAFSLKNVGFSLEPDKITGFIGRNGAGKSTTLKAIMGLVHPDGGQVSFFGKPFAENELEIKSLIGFVGGGADFYPGKKLKAITAVTKAFYPKWDDGAYREYMDMFSLDESKAPAQLSQGMKVKYALTLALSHNARLLILDEPTSGLDPISRDELLDIFLELQRRGVTILFSTHITSDLDKCADNIIYIRNGEIAAEEPLSAFTKKYRLVELSDSDASNPLLIGCKPAKTGCTALVLSENAAAFPTAREANLEEIMVHLERQGQLQ